jgi:hypothetical protein
VANTGLKVAVFSAIRKGLVRVAGKRAAGRKLTADSSQPTGEKKFKDNAPSGSG